jgi:hypothetical protein
MVIGRYVTGAVVAAALLLAGLLPAVAGTILSLAPTAAVTAQVSTPQTFVGGAPLSAEIAANFTYGSGGTSADAWVQTSLDGGQTWIDIANFHFTTSSLRASYNLSALTPVTTQYTATDGTLGTNTAKDGIIGQAIRVKYTTVGTYAGTTLVVTIDNIHLQ